MTKEDPSTGGLLSKVVKFVRNPTSHWADLDSLASDKESQYSKQMLKEMIERKRRNDFVRRREFDQLRKLRQREALQGQATEEVTGRPSFFQSSMASPDERASTLKKIDEIEAQMSQQWWKGKPGNEPTTRPASLRDFVDPAIDEARAFAPTEVVSLSPSQLDARLTVPASLQGALAPAAAVGRTRQAPLAPAGMDPLPPLAWTQRPAPPPPEPDDFVHDPDLEEAAILFANGDQAGAEAALLDVLQQRRPSAPDEQIDVWMTLFDLYRATGQHERFDTLGIDFAAHFGRSSPLWFSMPEQLGLAGAAAGHVGGAPAQAVGVVQEHCQFNWSSPSTLAMSSVAALQAALERAQSPWTLSWSRLAAIEEPALPRLADLFTRWADVKGQFVFTGAEALNRLLVQHTISGDRSGQPDWWRLRMALLRLMSRPDDFEMVALDYCVTYEVSPPSWAVPRCSYVDDSASLEPGHANMVAQTSQAPREGSAMPASEWGGMEEAEGAPGADRPADIALRGHIDGDAMPLLQALGEQMRVGEPLCLDCSQLIRMDFAAAGSVLNWAAEQQALGYDLRFMNLQRLVAIFFNIVGVNEHAWVVPRKN